MQTRKRGLCSCIVVASLGLAAMSTATASPESDYDARLQKLEERMKEGERKPKP